MRTGQTTVLVDLLDELGYETGRAVPVEIVYATDVDKSFGADADGNRGTVLVSREILDMFMEVRTLMGLNSAEVEQALASAKEQFERNGPR